MKSFFVLLSFLFAFSLNQSLAQGKLETKVREFFAAVDAGNFDAAEAYLSPDVKVYLPFSPEAMNREAYKGLGMAMKAGFPDIKHQILECAETGSSIGFKAWFSGTNNGSLMGNPATNNKVSLPFVAFFKFDNAGKILEINTQFDQTAFNNQLAAANPMANKQVAVSTLEALNGRNLDAVTANFAADATFYGWGPQPLRVDGYRKAMSELLNAFPDSKFTALDVTAEGSKVVVRHQFEGTHTGAAFQGVPATQRRVTIPATVIYEYKDGKATNLWLNADFLGLLVQLGAVPAPGGSN